MRCGFEGLAAIVQNTLGMNALSGGLFLFLGRRRDRVKILFWDRDGYALYSKRVERGRFPFSVLIMNMAGNCMDLAVLREEKRITEELAREVPVCDQT